jgi:hypothetical protein
VRAEDLRKVHFDLLRGAITPTGGIEVKNLGDGLMVTFTSPSRALACSVGMQQAIERHNRRAPAPLRVRIGSSVGEAGDAALAALAPDDAMQYRHALELLSQSATADPGTRCRALIGLGASQYRAGVPEHRATLAKAAALAQQLGDAALLLGAIFAAGRVGGGTTLEDAWRVGAVRRALESVGDADSATRARLLIALAHSLDARGWKQRRDLGTEAVDVARRVGDDGDARHPPEHDQRGRSSSPTGSATRNRDS